jgi:hypothetical protein
VHEDLQEEAQDQPEPGDEAAEVVAGGGKHGVDGITRTVSQEVPAHAVVLLGMADHGFDGGAALELAPDGGGDTALLALGIDLELVLGERIVAPIAGVREGAGKGRPAYGFNAGEHGVERVPVRSSGPAHPREIGWNGAGGWVIASHLRQVNFSRTCWTTFQRAGTYSNVSVISSPSLRNAVAAKIAILLSTGHFIHQSGRLPRRVEPL